MDVEKNDPDNRNWSFVGPQKILITRMQANTNQSMSTSKTDMTKNNINF